MLKIINAIVATNRQEAMSQTIPLIFEMDTDISANGANLYAFRKPNKWKSA